MIQLIVNAMAAGATYSLVAYGFAIQYRLTRVVNFAHAATYTVAAYTAFAVHTSGRQPLVVAVAGGVVTAGVFAIFADRLVFAPMRHARRSTLLSMLASMGVLVIVQSLVAIVFGNQPRVLRDVARPLRIAIGEVHISGPQIAILIVAIFLGVVLAIAEHWSSYGTVFRAVANNAELAEIHGIRANLVIAIGIGVGALAAAAAGIAVSFDTDLSPPMGYTALAFGIAAAFVGGIQRGVGPVLGGGVVGAAQQLFANVIDTQWQNTVVFALLILMLLIRGGYTARRV